MITAPSPAPVRHRLHAVGQDFAAWLWTNRWLFVVVLAVGAMLYYPVYAFGLENLDSLCTTEPYQADLWQDIPYWETQQGRWALRLFDALTEGAHPPFLTAMAVCLFFGAAGVLLCDLFEIRGAVLRTAAVLLLVCSQYVQNLQSYRYCKAAYACSFLLAVLSVVCVLRWPHKAGVAGGAACLMFAVALYQSSLGVAAVTCLLTVICRLLQDPQQKKELLHSLLRMLLMGIVGMAAYLVVLRVLLGMYDVTLSEINGISQVGLQSLGQLPQGILQAYRDFYEYFAGRSIAQNYYKIRPAYILLAGMSAAGVLWALGRGGRRIIAAVLGLLMFVPAAANITDIINPNSQILLRMGGYGCCAALCSGGSQLPAKMAGRSLWSRTVHCLFPAARIRAAKPE